MTAAVVLGAGLSTDQVRALEQVAAPAGIEQAVGEAVNVPVVAEVVATLVEG